MAEYKVDNQVNVGWGLSLQMAGKTPAIAKRIFDTYDNAKAFMDAIIKAKPAGAKGTYVKKISLSSTMGVGVKVDAAQL